MAQGKQESDRLIGQSLGPAPAFFHAKQAGISQLAARGVLLGALAGVLRRAQGIKQIVCNLKNEAETVAKTVEALKQISIRPRRPNLLEERIPILRREYRAGGVAIGSAVVAQALP